MKWVRMEEEHVHERNTILLTCLHSPAFCILLRLTWINWMEFFIWACAYTNLAILWIQYSFFHSQSGVPVPSWRNNFLYILLVQNVHIFFWCLTSDVPINDKEKCVCMFHSPWWWLRDLVRDPLLNVWLLWKQAEFEWSTAKREFKRQAVRWRSQWLLYRLPSVPHTFDGLSLHSRMQIHSGAPSVAVLHSRPCPQYHPLQASSSSAKRKARN